MRARGNHCIVRVTQLHYTNEDLSFALQHVGGFAKTQSGWIEQRAYVQHTVDALAAAPASDTGARWLHTRTRRELQQLRDVIDASLLHSSEWVEIDPKQEIQLPQFSAVRFNASAGGIARLRTRGSSHDFARAGGSLAQYQYQTLDEVCSCMQAVRWKHKYRSV